MDKEKILKLVELKYKQLKLMERIEKKLQGRLEYGRPIKPTWRPEETDEIYSIQEEIDKL